MGSPNGSIHTTHTLPPLSFYNTFNELKAWNKLIVFKINRESNLLRKLSWPIVTLIRFLKYSKARRFHWLGRDAKWLVYCPSRCQPRLHTPLEVLQLKTVFTWCSLQLFKVRGYFYCLIEWIALPIIVYLQWKNFYCSRKFWWDSGANSWL